MRFVRVEGWRLLILAAILATCSSSNAQLGVGEFEFFDATKFHRPEFGWGMRLSVGEFIVANLIDELSSDTIPQYAVLSTLQAKNEAEWILKGCGSLPNLRSHSWSRERDPKRLLQRGMLLWAAQQDYTTKHRYPRELDELEHVALSSLNRCLRVTMRPSSQSERIIGYAKLVLALCESEVPKRASKLMALGLILRDKLPHLALRCDVLRMEIYTYLGESQKATELAKKIVVRHSKFRDWMGYTIARDQARRPLAHTVSPQFLP